MFRIKGSQAARPTGPILFTYEGVQYERVKCVDEGPHGEDVLLVRRHGPKDRTDLVVVKTLRGPRLWRMTERLREEVKLVDRFRHPGIARVFCYFRLGSIQYAVSEFVEGASVSRLLGYAALRGKPLSEPFALYLCARIADVLDYVHTYKDEHGQPWGVIHRDVCPGNIRMGRWGQVKLANFGVAWARAGGREETTQEGWPLGDLDYVAPERLCPREPGAPGDARGDLFSLGLVLLELLTGHHLYYLERLEKRVAHAWTLIGHMYPNPPDAPLLCYEERELRADCYGPSDVDFAVQTLSAPVQALLHKVLQRDPAQRHASAAELREDLHRCLKTHRWMYTRWSAARDLARLQRDVNPLVAAAKAAGSFSLPGVEGSECNL